MRIATEVCTRLYQFATSPVRHIWRNSLIRSNRMPVSILFYHRVSDVFPNDWTISSRRFEEQIRWLSKTHDFVTLHEAQDRIRNGNRRPAVAVTFDDGYADNCLTAIPFLVKHQIPATYFVCADAVLNGTPFPHDVAQNRTLATNGIESLRLMSKAGIEIGAHTRTHADLGKISDSDTLFDEVVQSKLDLEAELDSEISYFAFPFGQKENLNRDVFELLKQHRFKGGCSAYGGYNSIGGDGFHLQRIHGDPSMARFKNWMTLDPRMYMTRSYQIPDLDHVQVNEAQAHGNLAKSEQGKSIPDSESVSQVNG